MKFQEAISIYDRRLPAYIALASMPELNHWPDRSKPFALESSEVLAFIAEAGNCTLKEANRILVCAQQKGLVHFDRKTKTWKGTGKPLKFTVPQP